MVDQLVDRYENLPGVKVGYDDNNLYSGQNVAVASTQSVLVLGSAVDGPVGQPISVIEIGGPQAAERLFGGMMTTKMVDTGVPSQVTGETIKKAVKVPNRGNLIRKMYELIDAGCDDIRLLRLDGKKAKTELQAEDVSAALNQPLGNAAGNKAFDGELTMEADSTLATDPIESVIELDKDDKTVHELTADEIKALIKKINDEETPVKISFNENRVLPGHKIEVKFKYNKRNYKEVQNTDEDGVLTQDPSNTHYYSSSHNLWSDNIQAGHTVNVFVGSNAIPQFNANGEFLWRIGKEDLSISDPLHDIYTKTEYQQGGIRFTTAYDREVDAGTYPALSKDVAVRADYFYYTEVAMEGDNKYDIPGDDTQYPLDYIPTSSDFSVYYESAGKKITLQVIDADHADGQYSILYPEAGSTEKVKVVVKSGTVPVGVRLFASYKTASGEEKTPVLIVEGLYPGEAYGSLKDTYDLDSYTGVSILVQNDTSASNNLGYQKIITFYKPESKQLAMNDLVLEYKTKDLPGVETLREFCNYVNNDPNNNIVHLNVPVGDGDCKLQGLFETPKAVKLGQKRNTVTSEYEFYIDMDKSIDDPERFPWLGSNGFFNTNDLASMKHLYEILGGIYEKTVDDYKLVTPGVYQNLENYAVDRIFLAEAFHNSSIGEKQFDDATGKTVLVASENKRFSTQLAQHCAIVTAKTWECTGVIAVRPVEDASLLGVQSYIDELCAGGQNAHYLYDQATNEPILNDDQQKVDIGGYLDVIYGPEVGMENKDIGTYYTSGDAAYTGLISKLVPTTAPTNQKVVVQGLRYILSEAQHNQLAGAHYVTFDRLVAMNGSVSYIVKTGVTAAGSKSDYQRRSTVNIVHNIVQGIRIVATPFIGQPNGLAQQHSLATAIQSFLDAKKEAGYLQDFEFEVYSGTQDKIRGNSFISLMLVPAFETQKIRTNVGLRASL
jgi:hypothetical protein